MRRPLSGPSFACTLQERGVIRQIARRAIAEIQAFSAAGRSALDIEMDLRACHANGCMLRLEQLLAASAMDFAHDVGGIVRCLDRTTGRILTFSPRYARPVGRRHAA